MLSRLGERCWTITNAMPLPAGIASRSSVHASSPPADAPIPTIVNACRGAGAASAAITLRSAIAATCGAAGAAGSANTAGSVAAASAGGSGFAPSSSMIVPGSAVTRGIG